MVFDVVSHDLGEQSIELAVVREDHMAPAVPRKSLGVNDGSRQTARSASRFEDHNLMVIEFKQLTRARQTARTSTDDHYLSPHRTMVTLTVDGTVGVVYDNFLVIKRKAGG